jgi:hypothetical protein
LLLLQFSAALRVSELVDLNVNDVARHSEGIVLTIKRSKTDQDGVGLEKAVPHGKRLRPVAVEDAVHVLLFLFRSRNLRGIGRPYLDRDPPHVAPINGKEYAAHRGVQRAGL